MKYTSLVFLLGATQAVSMNAWSLIKVQDDAQFYAAGDQGMTPNGVEYVRTIPE